MNLRISDADQPLVSINVAKLVRMMIDGASSKLAAVHEALRGVEGEHTVPAVA